MRTPRRPALAATAGVAALLAGAVLAGCATPSPGGTEPEPTATTQEPEPTSSEEEPGPTEPEPGEELPETAPTASGDNIITAPVQGGEVPAGVVVVSGEGTAFEATLLWRVLVAGTEDVVDEGFTMAGSMGEVGPFSFEVELEPGTYTAEVWQPDASDGEAGGPERIDLVAVSFTVE